VPGLATYSTPPCRPGCTPPPFWRTSNSQTFHVLHALCAVWLHVLRRRVNSSHREWCMGKTGHWPSACAAVDTLLAYWFWTLLAVLCGDTRSVSSRLWSVMQPSVFLKGMHDAHRCSLACSDSNSASEWRAAALNGQAATRHVAHVERAAAVKCLSSSVKMQLESGGCQEVRSWNWATSLRALHYRCSPRVHWSSPLVLAQPTVYGSCAR
jgi:hypothetical protein